MLQPPDDDPYLGLGQSAGALVPSQRYTDQGPAAQRCRACRTT